MEDRSDTQVELINKLMPILSDYCMEDISIAIAYCIFMFGRESVGDPILDAVTSAVFGSKSFSEQ